MGRPPSPRSTWPPTVGSGNFDKWTEGPALPEPRADASVVYIAGSIYVIGGRDAQRRSDDDRLRAQPRFADRRPWRMVDRPTTSRCPNRAATRPPRSRPDGLLLVGGSDASGPVTTTYKTLLNSTGKLGAWSKEQSLNYPQIGRDGRPVGDYLWLYGGRDANGPTGAVQRGAFGKAAAEGLPANPDVGKLIRWDVNNSANLPVARDNAIGLGRQRRDLPRRRR